MIGEACVPADRENRTAKAEAFYLNDGPRPEEQFNRSANVSVANSGEHNLRKDASGLPGAPAAKKYLNDPHFSLEQCSLIR
jgi:hypothetical protein